MVARVKGRVLRMVELCTLNHVFMCFTKTENTHIYILFRFVATSSQTIYEHADGMANVPAREIHHPWP